MATENIEKSKLKAGDKVMVISGGNSTTRQNKGSVGKILRFEGKNKNRVVVEGVNMVTRHKKQTGPQNPGGKITSEAAVDISNVMYYVEKISKPVKLKYKFLEDGSKVRGFNNPETGEFEQI